MINVWQEIRCSLSNAAEIIYKGVAVAGGGQKYNLLQTVFFIIKQNSRPPSLINIESLQVNKNIMYIYLLVAIISMVLTQKFLLFFRYFSSLEELRWHGGYLFIISSVFPPPPLLFRSTFFSDKGGRGKEEGVKRRKKK